MRAQARPILKFGAGRFSRFWCWTRVYQRRRARGARGVCSLRYHLSMPAPTNERQSLERERAELPAHVTNYQRELDVTPADQKELRERLQWQIRRVQKRMAEVERRLAGLGGEK